MSDTSPAIPESIDPANQHKALTAGQQAYSRLPDNGRALRRITGAQPAPICIYNIISALKVFVKYFCF